VIVVWSGWGADYYHLIFGGEDQFYGPKTRQAAKRLRASSRPLVIDQIRSALRPLRRIGRLKMKLLPAIARVQFFSSPLPYEYDLLKKSLGRRFRAEYLQINYGSVQDTFAGSGKKIRGNNILVGNSASLTNNHTEVFEVLKRQNLSGRKIIVPLSYGQAAYRDYVVKIGRQMFGAKFEPVTSFLSLPDYHEMLSSCSCAIMNQYRQQALGNIGTILYQGGRLYLSQKNVLAKFLRARGAHVSQLEELARGVGCSFSPLAAKEHDDNVRVVTELWGQDKVQENFSNFVKVIRDLHLISNKV
jgi:hypothetical protein